MEPAGYRPRGCKESDMTEATKHAGTVFIYLFLAVLVLHCCGLFSSCDAQACHCGNFSCCSYPAPGPAGFSSCSAWAG